MSFFSMGGYAAYVWPAFGAGAVVLIALLAISLRSLKRRDAELRRLEAASGGGRRTRGGTANDTEKEEAPS